MKHTPKQTKCKFAFVGALALITTIASTSLASADVGYMAKKITVPHRDVTIKLDIYFPARETDSKILHGSNPVFIGIELAENPKPVPGLHPVVIFSHGSGGNGLNTGWISKALAEEGMIVIAPNHPGTTSRDSHPEETLKTWERPQDISAIIDQLPLLFAGEMKADADHIGAVGFSLGGYSVLASAGAKVSKAAFLEHCDRSMNKELNECGWLTKGGLDLNDIDKERFEQSNFEPRISTVVSVDPGLAAAFTSESLKAMDRPVMIINLGSEGEVYEGVDGAPVARQIPGARFYRVENSWHFSFLGECTQIGPEILKAEKEDPVCDEYGGRDRDKIHKEIAGQIVTFMKTRLVLPN